MAPHCDFSLQSLLADGGEHLLFARWPFMHLSSHVLNLFLEVPVLICKMTLYILIHIFHIYTYLQVFSYNFWIAFLFFLMVFFENQ